MAGPQVAPGIDGNVSQVYKAVLDDRALASHFLSMVSQGTLRALSITCRRWRADAYRLAPDACRLLAQLTQKRRRKREEEPEESDDNASVKRRRLLERLRMSCQDQDRPQGVNPEQTGPPIEEPPGEMGPAGSRPWFRRRRFADTRTTDAELCAALERGAPGDVQRFAVCSSSVTGAGLSRALVGHWAALTEICLGNCGWARGSLPPVTGMTLRPLLRTPGPSTLRSLTLLDVPGVPLGELCVACPLERLQFRGRLTTSDVESLSKCSILRTLRLALEPRLVPDAFVSVFTRCRALEVVDVHGATDVSDQLLACLMLHAKELDEFYGQHSCSLALSPQLVDGFRSHFHSARCIIIDHVATESVL